MQKNLFVNIISYLNQLFLSNSIIILTNAGIKSLKIERFLPFRKLVFINDDCLENNLRVIESYLPEILFAISMVSDDIISINEAIEKLSNRGFPYSKTSFSKIFLLHKMLALFETMLFADIFNNVWDGRISGNRYYVYKGNSGIEYYQHYQLRSLLVKLFDKILIEGTNEYERGISSRRITFSFRNFH